MIKQTHVVDDSHDMEMATLVLTHMAKFWIFLIMSYLAYAHFVLLDG
jgi:hypothetical protein